MGAGDIGRKAALVTQSGGQALLLEHGFERVVHLGTPAHCLFETRCADRRHHEFLDIDSGVGVCAAVEDVHHRHRKDVSVRSAEVAEQGQRGRFGGGFGHRQGDAQDRVSSQPGLVRGSVEIEQCLIDQSLIVGGQSDDGRCDLVEDRLDRLLDAFTAVPGAPVTQLDSLVLTRGRPGRHGCAPEGTVDQGHLNLDGRIAARVENFASGDLLDDGHGLLLADRTVYCCQPQPRWLGPVF